jgi:hypothetical protein
MGSPFGNIEVRGERENNLMSYTWAAWGLESVVTWTLTPSGMGTHTAHGAVGRPAGSAAGLPGHQLRVAGFFASLEQVLARID